MKKKDDDWIKGVDKSIKSRGTEGKCTPITKPGCTGRAKALAKTFKKMAKKRDNEVESKDERLTQDSIEYKKMGLYLAEALGFRVDEIAPVIAAVGRVVAKKALGAAATKGAALLTDREKKKKELKAQAASDVDLEEGKIMNAYVRSLMEWEAGPTAKRIAGQAGNEEGRMSSTGKKIKDALVKREAAKTQANVDKKLGTKTNLRTKDAIQGSMNRRRAAAQKGKSVEGSAPLGPGSKKDRAADAAQDKKRREAPGDK